MGKKWLLLPGSELRVFCGIDQEQWDHVRPETEDEAKAFLLLQRWQGPGLSNGVVCARQPGCVLTSHYYYYYYYYCMGSCVFFSVCIMLYHTSNQPNLASNHPEFGQCKENTNTPSSTNLSPSFSIRALTEVKSPRLMVRSVCWVHESPISQYVPLLTSRRCNSWWNSPQNPSLSVYHVSKWQLAMSPVWIPSYPYHIPNISPYFVAKIDFLVTAQAEGLWIGEIKYSV